MAEVQASPGMILFTLVNGEQRQSRAPRRGSGPAACSRARRRNRRLVAHARAGSFRATGLSACARCRLFCACRGHPVLPSRMTTGSAGKIGNRPTSCSPAYREPPRRRRASIWQTGDTRRPIFRSFPDRRPDALGHLKRPFVVGLTTSLDRLVQVRRNPRLLSLNQAPETAYVDDERVKAEIACSPHVRRHRSAGDRRHTPFDRGNGGCGDQLVEDRGGRPA